MALTWHAGGAAKHGAAGAVAGPSRFRRVQPAQAAVHGRAGGGRRPTSVTARRWRRGRAAAPKMADPGAATAVESSVPAPVGNRFGGCVFTP
jgi:hypothetical protein